jgi:hypothetical protein
MAPVLASNMERRAEARSIRPGFFVYIDRNKRSGEASI